jgi:hypothetical protein
MGYDIKIVDLTIKNGKVYGGDEVDTAYLSYNWSGYDKVCFDHLFHKECKCERIHLWYIKDDCIGRRGDDVAQRAQDTLRLLAQHDVLPGIPDDNNCNWGYGCYTDVNGRIVNLDPEERLMVFAYHLKRFQDLGNEYPNCFFISSDSDSTDIILPNGETAVYYRNESESEEEPDLSIYFNHPQKGMIKVNTFKIAMEIYGLMLYTNDVKAEQWYDLAMKMPDAPRM